MTQYRAEPWIKAAECLSIGVEAFFPGVGEDWQSAKTRWGIYGGLSPQARKRYEPEWLAEQEGSAA